MSHNVHLLVACSDKKGLISAVSSFVEEHNGNVLRIDQYLAPSGGRFFLRMEIEGRDFGLGRESSPAPSRRSRASTRWTGAWPTPTPPSGWR